MGYFLAPTINVKQFYIYQKILRYRYLQTTVIIQNEFLIRQTIPTFKQYFSYKSQRQRIDIAPILIQLFIQLFHHLPQLHPIQYSQSSHILITSYIYHSAYNKDRSTRQSLLIKISTKLGQFYTNTLATIIFRLNIFLYACSLTSSKTIIHRSMSSFITTITRFKSNRKLVNPNPEIVQHLVCCVCMDVFEDPVRTICGHTFCYVCIQQWALIRPNCPVCKKPINSRKLEKDLIASAFVNCLPVQCSHSGCDWHGVESIRKKHQRCCIHKPKNEGVPEFGIKVESDLDEREQDQIQILDDDCN